MTSGQGQGQVSQLTRFPRLEEYAHFHYDTVEIGHFKVSIGAPSNSTLQRHGSSLDPR